MNTFQVIRIQNETQGINRQIFLLRYEKDIDSVLQIIEVPLN